MREGSDHRGDHRGAAELAPLLGTRPPELTVSALAEGAHHVLGAVGELDMATATRLEAAVEAALRAGASELVVDLHAVRFMDSTGLRAILRARQSCEDAGCQFFLVPAEHEEQRRLFNVSGLIGKLTFREPAAPRTPAGAQPHPAP